MRGQGGQHQAGTADDREAELDKWEWHIDARTAQLAVTEESGASAQGPGREDGRGRQNRDEAGRNGRWQRRSG